METRQPDRGERSSRNYLRRGFHVATSNKESTTRKGCTICGLPRTNTLAQKIIRIKNIPGIDPKPRRVVRVIVAKRAYVQQAFVVKKKQKKTYKLRDGEIAVRIIVLLPKY